MSQCLVLCLHDVPVLVSMLVKDYKEPYLDNNVEEQGKTNGEYPQVNVLHLITVTLHIERVTHSEYCVCVCVCVCVCCRGGVGMALTECIKVTRVQATVKVINIELRALW